MKNLLVDCLSIPSKTIVNFLSSNLTLNLAHIDHCCIIQWQIIPLYLSTPIKFVHRSFEEDQTCLGGVIFMVSLAIFLPLPNLLFIQKNFWIKLKMRGQELSVDTRRIIVNLHGKEGKSHAEIAALLSISRNTIAKTIQRWKNEAVLASKSRSGRPSKLTERERRCLKRTVDKDPTISAPKLVAKLKEEYDLDLHPETVRLAIHKFGYKSFYRRKKPHITSKNLMDRITYAKKYLDEPSEFWEKVLFTDESKYNIVGWDGRLKVWRLPGQGLNPKYTAKTVKHGNGGLMVWGCMSAKGVGKLHFIEGTMDHKMYIDILKENLPASVERLGLTGNYTFMQDNDPKHTAYNTRMYLLYNTPKVMKTPAQSPDLNPIEHLWDELERRIRTHTITDKTSLKAALSEEWDKIGSEITHKLVSSMPNRLREVLKMKGYATRY